MERLRARAGATIWTSNLLLLASAVFLLRFGEGLLGGARTNYFVETLGLSGGQVLRLEGIRELPGLGLMFIAALSMHLPLSQRAAVSLLVTGIGYGLFALVQSYTALIAVALIASLGLHSWMPVHSALGLCLTTKEKAGRVLGTLSSVGALASIVGMGVITGAARLFESLSLRAYFIAGGALISIAALLVARLPKDIGSTETNQPRLLLRRRYWLYYILTFFQGSRKQVLNTFGSLVLVESFGLKVWQISLLLLVSGVVNFVTAPSLGYLVDRFGERKTLSASYVLLALCCFGYATGESAWLLAALLIIIKLLVLLGMGLSTYVNRIAPPEELMPTLSAGISINHITSVAMPLIAGALLPFIQYTGVFWGTGAIILLSVPFALAIRVSGPSTSEAGPTIATEHTGGHHVRQ